MKRLASLLVIALSVLQLSAAKGAMVTRIDPTDWFVGLRQSSLQLMVYGPGIREAAVTTSRTDVHIDSLVRLDSPNYLLVYLDLHEASAGTLPLTFQMGKRRQVVNYTLKTREKRGEEHQGFSNADVLYLLMPDRFAQGAAHPSQVKGLHPYVEDRTQHSLRHGGDLEGIRQHLDYFNELGVTALWFTPILENNSPDDNGASTYHGYATTDYYRVDPRFGTNAQYRTLIDDAHAHGLKVVMDMIFNHCGFEHPWVSDLPAHDWLNTASWLPGHDRRDADGAVHTASGFLQTSYKITPVFDPYASKVDMRETVDGWFVPTMPDLNHRNGHLMTYLIQNSIWWIETAGIDGIRMDTYPYADAQGMARWMKTLDEEYPSFNVVGETWVTEPAYTAAWQKGSRLTPYNSYLKTVMDFSFFDRLAKAKDEETDAWWNGYNRLYNSFLYDYLYADPTHVMAFIDNHDTDRFLGHTQDIGRLQCALALLLTVRRIPQLYYGTEILMNGTKEVSDRYVRADFPGGFPGDTRNAFTAEGRTPAEQQMFQWLSRLLHWRQGNETIVSGQQTQFTPWKGVYVVARRLKDDTVITVINGNSHEATLEVERFAELWRADGQPHDISSCNAADTIAQRTEAVDVPTGRHFNLSSDVQLAPHEALVLELQ